MQKYSYGAGYYPLMQKKEDWSRDLQTMKEIGINFIRTAEIFNGWDQIEYEKGKYRFEFLDEFFDLCAEYDIGILLGTGASCPPYWLHELDPNVNILSNQGKRFPNNATYSWACRNNTNYIEACKSYTETLIKRYKDHEALFAYQIDNEIGYPFMPLQEGDIDVYCYCDYCKKQFREWLKSKYNTLENLNYAWRWSATNTYHTSWEQAEPPYVKPTSWSSITRWLDFRLFHMESIVGFVKWQNELIKKLDNNHLTTTNIFYLKSQDPLGVLTALDQFEMAKVVDNIGYDLYPGSGDKLESKPEFSSMFLDHARSISKPLGKDYWIAELESGPINGWVLGPHRNTKAFDIERNGYEVIGHDAKSILYMGFREWDFQPLHWGALVDLDGNTTERVTAAKELGEFLSSNSEFLLNATTGKGEIALLTSKENQIAINGMGQEKFLLKALRGAYRVFWEKGYTIDFITPEQLFDNYAMDYKVICMPFMTMIEQDLANKLAEYVNTGGLLIGTARTGYLGKNGWYNHGIPCFNLEEVFGISAKEVWSDVKPKISYHQKEYDGHWHQEKIEIVQETVNVLGRFWDDSPAVTLNKYGKGRAIYFATHPDVAYLENNSYLMWDILDEVFCDSDIEPYIKVDYVNRKAKEIDVHSLVNGDKELLIITNYISKKQQGFFNNNMKNIRVSLNRSNISRIKNYRTGAKIPFSIDGNKIKFEISIIKNEVTLIEVNS